MGNIHCSYPFVFMLAFLVAFDSGGDLLLLLAAATLHELGHLLAIGTQGGQVQTIRLTAGGMVIEYNGSRLSYLADTAVALAGPTASFLGALALGRLASWCWPEPLTYLAGLSLMLGLFNLMPVLPLDGGRALYALLCLVRCPQDAEQICGALGRLCSCLLLVLGGWLLIRFENPSLLLISFLLLLGEGDKNTLQSGRFGVL